MWSIWPLMSNSRTAAYGLASFALLAVCTLAAAEPLPAGRDGGRVYAQNDAYSPPHETYGDRRDEGDRAEADAYRPDSAGPPDYSRGGYRGREGGLYDDDAREEPPPPRDEAYGERYDGPPPPRDRYDADRYDDGPREETYTENEILHAGHQFFGSISQGLARAVEHAFKSQGRPNGYILGEDAGGAFVAGLRYGEGKLYTKYDGDHRVYWQGPSIGYDFGGEGSKTMVLVYNLRDPSDIYHRFPGVQGSAYLVGGVGIQFQKYGDVVLAPIRSGIGLRLGANVGYLKYTRAPTWNPF